MKRVMTAILLLSLLLPLSAEELKFSEMYKETVRGLVFTPRLIALSGKEINMTGFMAPPLRAAGNFFVLTKIPVSLCPFCNSDADWPSDIMVVYLKTAQSFVQHNRPLMISGRLETGSFTDPETGFVSLVRIVDAEFRDR